VVMSIFSSAKSPSWMAPARYLPRLALTKTPSWAYSRIVLSSSSRRVPSVCHGTPSLCAGTHDLIESLPRCLQRRFLAGEVLPAGHGGVDIGR
jgi:hypothetical protein